MRAHPIGRKSRSPFRDRAALAALLVLLAAMTPTLSACLDDGAGADTNDTEPNGADTLGADGVFDDVGGDGDETTGTPPDVASDSDTRVPDASGPEVATVELLSTPLQVTPVVHEATDTRGLTMAEVLAADVDDDGFLDLVGITDSGDIYVSRIERGASVRPPFAFRPTDGPFPSNLTNGRLATGDFDADGRTDLVVLEREQSLGRVAVLLNLGLGHFGSPIAFEDPLFGFEDPLFGAEVGIDRAIADLDGNGHDDLVLISGEQTLALALFGPSTEDWSTPIALRTAAQDLRSFEDPLFGFEDPLFGIPQTIAALQLDDDKGHELVLGMRPRADEATSELVLFEDPLFGFEDPLFGFEDPLFGFGRSAIPGTLQHMVVTRLDADADAVVQADIVALATLDGSSVVAEYDLAGFEDPLFGLDPELYGVEGLFDRIDATRLLGRTEAGGAGGSALPVEPITHLMLSSSEAVMLVHELSDGTVVARSVEDPTELLDRLVADFNADGFAEFADRRGGFRYVAQEQLDAPAELVEDHLYSAETRVCSVSAPLCSAGSFGVCAGAHTDCDDTCVPNAPDPLWAEKFEAGAETHCDGLDNNCDGLIDVRGHDTSLTLSFASAGPTVAVRDVQIFDVDNVGLKALVQLVEGTRMTLYHGLVTAPLTQVTEVGALDAATANVRVAAGGGGLAVVSSDNQNPPRTVIFHGDGSVEGPVSLSGVGPVAVPVYAAGTWQLITANGGALAALGAVATGVPQPLLELTSDIVALEASATATGAVVVVRTAAQRLLVLDLELRVDGRFAVRDVHQLVLGEGNEALAVRIGADVGSDPVVCVTWAEQDAAGHRRLFATPIRSSASGLRLGAETTLSHHGVDPLSLQLEARDGRCQVAWAEPVGETGAAMLRQAFVSPLDAVVQDLSVHGNIVDTALTIGSNGAELVALEQPLLTGGAIELRHNALCR